MESVPSIDMDYPVVNGGSQGARGIHIPETYSLFNGKPATELLRVSQQNRKLISFRGLYEGGFSGMKSPNHRIRTYPCLMKKHEATRQLL